MAANVLVTIKIADFAILDQNMLLTLSFGFRIVDVPKLNVII